MAEDVTNDTTFADLTRESPQHAVDTLTFLHVSSDYLIYREIKNNN